MTTTTYLWDAVSDNLLSEYDGLTETVYTNEPARFGDLVSQRKDINTNFYHFDARGDTKELTDHAEVVTDTRIYDAWGNVMDSNGTLVSPFQFVGKIGYAFERADGRSYVRARWYSTDLQIWLSTDPVGVGGLHNLYEYIGNNPILNLDPSGEFAVVPDALGPPSYNKEQFKKGDCCLITGIQLICRTMPAALNYPGARHCYLAFSGKDGVRAVISGWRDEQTGLLAFADDYWDLNYALGIAEASPNTSQILGSYVPPPQQSLCDLYDCFYEAALAQHGSIGAYNQFTNNSNTFVQKVIEKCGGWANFPAGAQAAVDVGPRTHRECVADCVSMWTGIYPNSITGFERSCEIVCSRHFLNPIPYTARTS